ncbi:hypothetical protein [Nitratireductor thuwali]|uniref:hypothetical protein n=1 Tax=Nitratireductor thuwali TaxID=2267699 RepID=UPI0030D4F201
MSRLNGEEQAFETRPTDADLGDLRAFGRGGTAEDQAIAPRPILTDRNSAVLSTTSSMSRTTGALGVIGGRSRGAP